ncbi:Magnesium transporter NIPA [Penicillium maclennaniae]|uniref:Magnesium transporter NIPA n=1 Tax=Penicillium maclennaniae TaxID=1343394 RepID=UPI00253FA30D|nr:Magnesium transporter NIPA [Penicillium maclennaniae]KAJ5670699.1 Magnesium transporter NIPA [Penicillium maclennaniae]
MCYGAVSGILSAHSLLLAKSAVELLVRTLADGKNQFNRWQSWVILLAMISLALTQLFYLHRGLKLCSTSILYPFVFCIYNIIAILDGLIYFRQTSQLGGLHAGLIALGTVILLGGVLCLSWRLEDIDNHAAVTTVGSTQTGLGPGMGIVEEQHSSTSNGLIDGTDDEESQVGEQDPLLGAVRPRLYGSYHRARAPSLPLIPPGDHGEAADLNAASIWAELDDSDYDFFDPQIHSLGGSATQFKRQCSAAWLRARPRAPLNHWCNAIPSYTRLSSPSTYTSRPLETLICTPDRVHGLTTQAKEPVGILCVGLPENGHPWVRNNPGRRWSSRKRQRRNNPFPKPRISCGIEKVSRQCLAKRTPLLISMGKPAGGQSSRPQ